MARFTSGFSSRHVVISCTVRKHPIQKCLSLSSSQSPIQGDGISLSINLMGLVSHNMIKPWTPPNDTKYNRSLLHDSLWLTFVRSVMLIDLR